MLYESVLYIWFACIGENHSVKRQSGYEEMTILRIRTTKRKFKTNEIIKINGREWYCYCILWSNKLKDYMADFYKVNKAFRKSMIQLNGKRQNK
jgi:predicted SPOUT superfamily RNA methylase MTH1